MEKRGLAYSRALEKVIELLEQVKTPYMIVGGVAVAYYGYPRMTLDVDVMIELSLEDTKRLVKLAKRAKFDIHEGEVLESTRVGNRFVAMLGERRVDFWLAKSGREREMLSRRRRVKLFGKQTWICSLEDLVLSKLDAGRNKNHDDVLGILIRQGEKIRRDDLLEKAREFGAKDKLEELMKKAEKVLKGR